jgi:hypothetical protein
VLKYNCDDAGLYVRIQSFWDLVPTGTHTIDDEDKAIEVFRVRHRFDCVELIFMSNNILVSNEEPWNPRRLVCQHHDSGESICRLMQ